MSCIKKVSFKVDIFSVKVSLYLYDTDDSMVIGCNRIIKKHGEEPMQHQCHGITFAPDDDGSIYYIFLSLESLDINTITHETDHIRNYIMNYFNISQDLDSNETSANLSGYINEKVFSFLKQYKIKM